MSRESRHHGKRTWLRWGLGAAVGAFFVFSAAAKLADFDGFLEKAAYYRAVPYVWMVRSAWLTIALEGVVGAALIAGRWRRLAIAAAAGMLLVFTALVAHAWHAYGITDCGCLGSLAETPPWFGITKNVVMVSLLALAWPWRRRPAVAQPALS
ncbi:MAG: DoxX family protein [Planctomycetes bacterium]|nr:DoxX family protein [Planctomycetota bacterium]